ncbi:MAG: ABC transporter permease [Planctomycetia bacterium]|nr:ABC transporter permease [Planctomycetia bacterium]
MHRLWILLKKELLQLVKSPKMRMTLFFPPIMQLLVLGYAATLELKHVDLGILDFSNSAESRALIAEFTGSPTFNVHPALGSEEELRRLIETRKIQIALVIPNSFALSVHGKDQPDVQIIADGRSTNSAGLATAYVQNMITDYRQSLLQKDKKIHITSRAWYNPNYQARYFMVPAVLAMIALIDVMLINALALSKEREEGTFDQLRLTPLSSFEILAAKGISSVLIGVCQLTVGLLVIHFWFQVPMRSSFLLLAALLTSFLFAAMGLGLLISVLSRNLQQAILATFGVILPFSMLSGLSTPVESMPDSFQLITLINPLRHGVNGIPQCYLEGATFNDLLYTFIFLWAIATGAFALAWYFFRGQRQCG